MRVLWMAATAVGCLSSYMLQAQETKADSAQYKIEYAAWKATLAGADKKMEERQQQYLEAQNKKVKYDTLGLAQYRYEYALLKNERRQQEIAFIKAHPGYMVSIEALDDAIGALPDDIVKYSKLYRGLDKPVRNSDKGKKLYKKIEGFMAVRIGSIAPLFDAPDTSGHQLSLKDLRGKYVLLDFWASWCGPCREENPQVVKAYEQFKDLNFTIIGISLDQPGKKEAWVNAIQKDGLTWYHVSDLQYWKNAVAQLYSIRSIPQNFLLDPKGRIIAANLRGEALTKKLEELILH